MKVMKSRSLRPLLGVVQPGALALLEIEDEVEGVDEQMTADHLMNVLRGDLKKSRMGHGATRTWRACCAGDWMRASSEGAGV